MNDKLVLHFPHESYRLNSNFENYFTQEDRNKTIPGKPQQSTIKYYYNPDNYNADINGHGLRVSFNPNKIKGQAVGTLISYRDFIETTRQVESDLQARGVDFKVMDGKISRYDNSFDLQTSEMYSCYEPIIRTLTPNTRGIKQGRQRLIENSLYFGNNSKEIIIYDKSKESGLKENFMRFELRHLKLSSKEKMQLWQVDKKKYYDNRSQDKEIISNTLFNRNPGVLDYEYIKYAVELIKTDMRLSEIYRNMFYCVLSTEQARSGVDIFSVIAVPRNHKHYKRGLQFRQEMQRGVYIPPNLTYAYDELKTLLRKAV